MPRFHHAIALGLVGLLAARSALADPKIDETVIGESGKWAGYALSPRGVHVAALLNKGSRFIVQIDGADGPRIDQLIGAAGSPYMSGASNTAGGILTYIPVVFSDDGAHCAYFAKVGEEFILIADNKEIARGKYTGSELMNPMLTVTSGGKHVLFRQASPTGGYQIVVDGKPGPSSHVMPTFIVSPDGAHYAYQGTQADGNDTKWAVVDGRQVKYFGDDLQFTAKGHLVAVEHGKGVMALTVDNKNVMQAANIGQIWISPHGGEIAAMANPQPGAKAILTINGKAVPIPDAATVMNVYFSPDDQHHAALVTSGTSSFIVLDGKKQENYQSIFTGAAIDAPAAGPRAWAAGRAIGTEIALEGATPEVPSFTADSSKFVYVALSAGKSFLVTNEDESEPMPSTFTPIFSSDGKHIAYIVSQGVQGKKAQIVLDGKTITLNGRPGALSSTPGGFLFGPDGAHYAFSTGGILYRDGAELSGINCNGPFLFSPDGAHLLFLGSSAADPNKYGMFLDDKLVAAGPGMNNATRPTFSPDGKHVYWIGTKPSETSDDHDNGVLYVDGKPTAVHFPPFDANQSGNWETSADDALTLVARSGADLKRFHITPGSDSSVATMLANGTSMKK